MTELPNTIVDFANARAPIYVQLSTLFRRFIVTGQWPVQKQVPTHEALAGRFDVNQATVRKAIAILEGEGLVQRFRRRGTFVVARPQATAWLALPAVWDDALSAFDGYEFEEVTARVVRDAPPPFHGRGLPASSYRFSRRIFRNGGRPFALEEAYLDRGLEKTIGSSRVRRLPLLPLAAVVGKIEHADQTIRFGIADAEISAALNVPLNAPVAIVYWSLLGARSLRQLETTIYFRGDAVRVREPISFGRPRRAQ